ncbi:MAG: U32 family peptidase [Bacilli bacterium]|nr:U32 family peptidase [Bacilli bacterium]
MTKKVELLAPAGDLERLKFSLLYGADAVYIGGQEYSLRANANNFSIDEIREACTFAHNLNKKVYLTLNIVFHNEDLENVNLFIKQVVDAGIDAFIVSDPFIIKYIKENFDVEVHLSTQGSTTNVESVKYWKDEGVDRVVLAREVSIKEIEEIYKETGLDLEVFIHGAMCTFYSGRCCLSNYFTNRDSNRGGCAQICRFAFDIANNDTKFTLATKDLNMASILDKLISTGVKSLKVEGRMRSPYYLATVISSYRKLIDAYYDGSLNQELIDFEEKILSRVANRETSTHYYLKEADYNDQYYTGRQELSNQDFLALVLDYDKETGIATITERNYFKVGDEVEIFTPNGDIVSFTVEKLYDENMNPIDVARHPEEILKLYVPKEVVKDSMMRVKIN